MLSSARDAVVDAVRDLSEEIYRCSAVEKGTDDKLQKEMVTERLLCATNRGRAKKDEGDRNRILNKMEKLASTKDGAKSDYRPQVPGRVRNLTGVLAKILNK
jgi:hypothetical protein